MTVDRIALMQTFVRIAHHDRYRIAAIVGISVAELKRFSRLKRERLSSAAVAVIDERGPRIALIGIYEGTADRK